MKITETVTEVHELIIRAGMQIIIKDEHSEYVLNVCDVREPYIVGHIDNDQALLPCVFRNGVNVNVIDGHHMLRGDMWIDNVATLKHNKDTVDILPF